MGVPQGLDLKGLQHLVSTLKRVVLFDDYISLVNVASGLSMATSSQLNVSNYVSAKATAIMISLFNRPVANASWQIFTDEDNTIGTKINLQTYSHAINIWNTIYGIQTIANDKTFYYRSQKLAGGGNASWIVRLHGYIEPT